MAMYMTCANFQETNFKALYGIKINLQNQLRISDLSTFTVLEFYCNSMKLIIQSILCHMVFHGITFYEYFNFVMLDRHQIVLYIEARIHNV